MEDAYCCWEVNSGVIMEMLFIQFFPISAGWRFLYFRKITFCGLGCYKMEWEDLICWMLPLVVFSSWEESQLGTAGCGKTERKSRKRKKQKDINSCHPGFCLNYIGWKWIWVDRWVLYVWVRALFNKVVSLELLVLESCREIRVHIRGVHIHVHFFFRLSHCMGIFFHFFCSRRAVLRIIPRTL